MKYLEEMKNSPFSSYEATMESGKEKENKNVSHL